MSAIARKQKSKEHIHFTNTITNYLHQPCKIHINLASQSELSHPSTIFATNVAYSHLYYDSLSRNNPELYSLRHGRNVVYNRT